MKETASEISKSPEAQRETERARILPQVRDLVRQSEKDKARDRCLEKDKELDLER